MQTIPTPEDRQTRELHFPNRLSELVITDPELMEVFGNFAFGEVIRYGGLDERTRYMAIIAASIASQGVTQYKVTLEAALECGLLPCQAKEIVYQAVPYVGMARVLDFLHATNEVLAERGVKLPLPAMAPPQEEDRIERGIASQKTIFGDRQIEDMRRDAPSGLRHIQDFLSANCFGDYVSREGLDLQTREMLTFSMLLSLGGCEAQLRSHIQGNLNMGNDKEFLIAVATQLIPYIGYPKVLNGMSCISEVSPEN